MLRQSFGSTLTAPAAATSTPAVEVQSTSRSASPLLKRYMLTRTQQEQWGFHLALTPAGEAEANAYYRIVRIDPHSPAAKCNQLQVKDQIRSINGRALNYMSQELVEQFLDSIVTADIVYSRPDPNVSRIAGYNQNGACYHTQAAQPPQQRNGSQNVRGNTAGGANLSISVPANHVNTLQSEVRSDSRQQNTGDQYVPPPDPRSSGPIPINPLTQTRAASSRPPRNISNVEVIDLTSDDDGDNAPSHIIPPAQSASTLQPGNMLNAAPSQPVHRVLYHPQYGQQTQTAAQPEQLSNLQQHSQLQQDSQQYMQRRFEQLDRQIVPLPQVIPRHPQQHPQQQSQQQPMHGRPPQQMQQQQVQQQRGDRGIMPSENQAPRNVASNSTSAVNAARPPSNSTLSSNPFRNRNSGSFGGREVIDLISDDDDDNGLHIHNDIFGSDDDYDDDADDDELFMRMMAGYFGNGNAAQRKRKDQDYTIRTDADVPSGKRRKSSTGDAAASSNPSDVKLEFEPKKFGEADIADEVVEVRNPELETTENVSNSNGVSSAKIQHDQKNDTKAASGVDSDDDIEFVGGNMTVASDMPHQREACTKYPFSIVTTTQRPMMGTSAYFAYDAATKKNLRHCNFCYCYVCEVPVSECKDWTTHCNGTYKISHWKEERSLRNSLILRLLEISTRNDFVARYKPILRHAQGQNSHSLWFDGGSENRYGNSLVLPPPPHIVQSDEKVEWVQKHLVQAADWTATDGQDVVYGNQAPFKRYNVHEVIACVAGKLHLSKILDTTSGGSNGGNSNEKLSSADRHSLFIEATILLTALLQWVPNYYRSEDKFNRLLMIWLLNPFNSIEVRSTLKKEVERVVLKVYGPNTYARDYLQRFKLMEVTDEELVSLRENNFRSSNSGDSTVEGTNLLSSLKSMKTSATIAMVEELIAIGSKDSAKALLVDNLLGKLQKPDSHPFESLYSVEQCKAIWQAMLVMNMEREMFKHMKALLERIVQSLLKHTVQVSIRNNFQEALKIFNEVFEELLRRNSSYRDSINSLRTECRKSLKKKAAVLKIFNMELTT